MGVERHLRPLLHKAYRLKLSAWPQIRQSLVDTTARVIVRLDETNREDLWCRLLSSGLNCDSMSNVTQEELRRLFHDSTSHSNRRGRNLVGGVLMKLRELLGRHLSSVTLTFCHNYVSSGVQAAFLSTGVRHSLEKRAIFSSGASSFEGKSVVLSIVLSPCTVWSLRVLLYHL